VILSEHRDDVTLVNRMCHLSTLPFGDKYFLFEANDIDQQVGRLLDLFLFQLDAIRTGTNSLDPSA
jgi:hypothetical protein